MAADDVINILNGSFQKVLKFFRMSFQCTEILLTRAALMRDYNKAALLKCLDCRKVFPETFVVEDTVRSRIKRGVQVQPKQDRLPLAPDIAERTDRHNNPLSSLSDTSCLDLL